MQYITTGSNLLLQRNNVGHSDLNELDDAAPTGALDTAAYDEPCQAFCGTTEGGSQLLTWR